MTPLQQIADIRQKYNDLYNEKEHCKKWHPNYWTAEKQLYLDLTLYGLQCVMEKQKILEDRNNTFAEIYNSRHLNKQYKTHSNEGDLEA